MNLLHETMQPGLPPSKLIKFPPTSMYSWEGWCRRPYRGNPRAKRVEVEEDAGGKDHPVNSDNLQPEK